MSFGPLIAPIIAQPHIVALSGEHEGWGFLSEIANPVIGWGEEPVLQEYDWGTRLKVLILYSEHLKDVAILSNDVVTFKIETGILCYLFEGKMVIFGLVFVFCVKEWNALQP